MNKKIFAPIALLFVFGMVFYFNVGPAVPEGFQNVQALEAQMHLRENKDVSILDIRTSKEFQQGHIPGAINIDYLGGHFEQQISELDRNAQYLVYCRSGNRSRSALRIMEKLGFKRVWHLNNGIIDWKNNGLSLKK